MANVEQTIVDCRLNVGSNRLRRESIGVDEVVKMMPEQPVALVTHVDGRAVVAQQDKVLIG